jgi:hypothetical protein
MGMEDFLTEQELTPIVAELINICKVGNAQKALKLIHSLIRMNQAEEVLAQFNIEDEYDNNYNEITNSKMLICINLNIYFSIIMKRLKIIVPENSVKKIDKQMIDIINSSLQENVLDYIDFNINALSFPNYYINYVKYICNNIML